MNMDQIENQNFQTIDKFHKHQFPIRTLQLALSIVSIFSLYLFYSSGYVIFTNFCNFYYSSVLFSFFKHTLERKYMFLLCNGILAFLVKSISFSPPSETLCYSHIEVEVNPSSATKLENYEASMDLETVNTPQDNNNVAPGVDGEIKEEPKKEEKGGGGGDGGEAEIVEEQNAEELSNEEEDERQGEGEGEDEEQGEGEEEEEEEEDDDDYEEDLSGSLVKELLGSEVVSSREDSLSPEELNKKFEEFIRKMKEEIRIEAQSQLIAV